MFSNHINNVAKWWSKGAQSGFEGKSTNLNDEFIIRFGDRHYSKQMLIEVIPNKKLVWLVTDCYLSWFNDKTEWKNTKMSFEILTKGNSTEISFTHIGLVPQVECYNNCVKGWDQYVKGSLFKLITEGKGQPQKKK